MECVVVSLASGNEWPVASIVAKIGRVRKLDVGIGSRDAASRVSTSIADARGVCKQSSMIT